jgi:predicted RNA-binding Zn ribbon-like protein
VSGFRFGLGHVTLEFLATLGDRSGRRVERLCEPGELSRWLTEAGLADSPRTSTASLLEARELRESIYRVLDCARNGGRPPTIDLKLVNEWALRPVAAPQIGRDFARSSVGPDALTGALSQLARESVELVTGPELARVRSCAGCSLLFIDRSRPGRRRWCSMERCGNRDKTARYREKRQRA